MKYIFQWGINIPNLTDFNLLYRFNYNKVQIVIK